MDARELESSVGVLEPEVLAALRTAIANVRAVAKAQLREPGRGGAARGPRAWRSWRCRSGALGIYVPGAARAYPSTVVMGAVTARAAGVDGDRGLRPARAGRARPTR